MTTATEWGAGFQARIILDSVTPVGCRLTTWVLRDIHLHTEILVDGVWLHYSKPRINRDYDLFAFLNKLALQRGIPADVTATTRFCYLHQESDFHDESYVIGDEVRQLEDWMVARDHERPRLPGASPHSELDYLFGNSWGGFYRWPEERGTSYPAEITEIRFVFWYDN